MEELKKLVLAIEWRMKVQREIKEDWVEESVYYEAEDDLNRALHEANLIISSEEKFGRRN